MNDERESGPKPEIEELRVLLQRFRWDEPLKEPETAQSSPMPSNNASGWSGA